MGFKLISTIKYLISLCVDGTGITVSETLFIVGIVTFVICLTLPFVFMTGFLVMKLMRTKGKVKQMTKVTIPTTKRGSDTVVPVEPGLYCG